MISEPSTATPARAPGLAILILVSTVMPIGLNMYIPALAAMQRDLETTTTLIQLSLSLFLAATALGQIIVGPLSDVVGRRPVLLVGLALFVVGSLMCSLAPGAEVLLFGRVVQALGGSAGFSLARAIIRDVHGSRQSASLIGYVTMGMAIAPLVTPVIGGFVADLLDWRVIFDLMAAYGGLLLLAAAFMLPETRPQRYGGGRFRAFREEARKLLGLGDFWIYAGTLALLASSFFSFIAAGTFVAVEVFGLGASEYGLFLTFVVIGYILGNFVTGRFGERIGLSRLIVVGNLVALVGVLLAIALVLLAGASPFGLFAPMLLLGLGNGLALPNAVAGAVSVKPELAGTSAGLAGAFQVGGGAVVSFLIGLMIDAGLWAGTVWVMLVPMLIGSAGAVVLGSFTDDRKLG